MPAESTGTGPPRSTARQSPATVSPVTDDGTKRNNLVSIVLVLAYFGVILLGVLGLVSTDVFLTLMVVGTVVSGSWLWWTRR